MKHSGVINNWAINLKVGSVYKYPTYELLMVLMANLNLNNAVKSDINEEFTDLVIAKFDNSFSSVKMYDLLKEILIKHIQSLIFMLPDSVFEESSIDFTPPDIDQGFLESLGFDIKNKMELL